MRRDIQAPPTLRQEHEVRSAALVKTLLSKTPQELDAFVDQAQDWRPVLRLVLRLVVVIARRVLTTAP